MKIQKSMKGRKILMPPRAAPTICWNLPNSSNILKKKRSFRDVYWISGKLKRVKMSSIVFYL